MNGYMIFSLDENNNPLDSFYISKDLNSALVEHLKYFNYKKIELVIRSCVPYLDKSEKEVRIVGDKEEVVSEDSPDYGRCLFCMDFFPSENIHHVKPFGEHQYEAACEGCIQYEGLSGTS